VMSRRTRDAAGAADHSRAPTAIQRAKWGAFAARGFAG